jgi:hypothetical protein
MMKLLVSIFLVVIFFHLKAQTVLLDESTKNHIDQIIMSCNSEEIEFKDLYVEPTQILIDSTEFSIIAEYLKSKGFVVTDFGRGNWPLGPRIVSQKLVYKDCNCQVDKLYYSPNLDDRFKTTERIICAHF